MTVGPLDLCTLADVRLALQKASGAVSLDDRVTAAIPRASDAIMDHTGCEFRTERGALNSTNPAATFYDGVAALDFYYEGGGSLVFDWRCSLRTLTSVAISDGGASPVWTTLTADDYRFVTRNPRGGVHHRLLLLDQAPCSQSSRYDVAPSKLVRVTGTWGFAAVPPAVVEACAETVIHWQRQVEFLGGGYNPDQTAPSDGKWALPGFAKSLLGAWKRVHA